MGKQREPGGSISQTVVSSNWSESRVMKVCGCFSPRFISRPMGVVNLGRALPGQGALHTMV